MAKTKAKKRKTIKDEEEADKEEPVAKKMKIKKEEEVVEEDSSAPKIFGKTKSKRVVKKDKTLGSSEALPLKKVVVPAPDAKPTLTLLPETTRRSSRARKPSAKFSAAAAVAKATEMKKATTARIQQEGSINTRKYCRQFGATVTRSELGILRGAAKRLKTKLFKRK